MAIDEAEVRTALGIDEEIDPVAAIRNLFADNAALRATISGDKGTANQAAVMQLRADLAAAQRTAMEVQSVSNQRLAELQEERRVEKAQHKVENLIFRGKLTEKNRTIAVNVALTMPEEEFDEWAKTLQGVDLTERGVASGSEVAEFAPTASEMATARNMGIDPNSKEWQIGIMRSKAKAKGLTLPEEVA